MNAESLSKKIIQWSAFYFSQSFLVIYPHSSKCNENGMFYYILTSEEKFTGNNVGKM